MTRLERKEEELRRLYDYRAAALRSNDIMWLMRNNAKIDALEKEIIEMKRYKSERLSDSLKDAPEGVKNELYKSLLRISLLSDVVNEACMRCKAKMEELGIVDYSLKKEVAEMNALSQKIASFVLGPKQKILEDFIVNDEKVVDGCMILCDRYLNEKLNL